MGRLAPPGKGCLQVVIASLFFFLERFSCVLAPGVGL